MQFNLPAKKELGITTCAYLKSIIESRADPDTWADKLRIALNLHFSVVETLTTTVKKDTINA